MKNSLKLVFALSLLAFLLTGRQPGRAQQVQPPPAPEAESLTGVFAIAWEDSRSGQGTGIFYELATADGQIVKLEFTPGADLPLEELLALQGQTVQVSGQMLSRPASTGRAAGVFAVEQLQVEAEAARTAPLAPTELKGSVRWVTLLCKFHGLATEPKPLAYFQGMYGDAAGQLNHYWKEQSYNQMNVDGSAAYDWVELEHDRAYYMASGSFDLHQAGDDCALKANATYAALDFNQFDGISMMFNDELTGSSKGGTHSFPPLDGKTYFRVTWEPPWGYKDITVVKHEMGHGHGLPHSGHDPAYVYTNFWDVMSDTWTACASFQDATYGCMGQGTIGYHKNRLGWLPADKVVTAGAGISQTYSLDLLGAATAQNLRMVIVPIAGTNRYYTLEARGYPTTGAWKTYDYKFQPYLTPNNQAIIIHEVDPARGAPAWNVGNDLNYISEDAGSIFLPGENWSPPGTNIVFHIRALTATGLSVGVDNDSAHFRKTQPVNNASGVAPAPTLAWGATAGASGYEYCYDESNNNACDGIWTSTGSEQQAILPTLAVGKTYYWQVRAATNEGLKYADEAWWSFTTLAPPAAFIKTAPAHGTLNQAASVAFQWQAAANTHHYEVCLDLDGAGECWYRKTTNATATTINLSAYGLDGSTLFWQVRAINDAGGTAADDGRWWQFTLAGGSSAPGSFGKASPANGATGQPSTLGISWSPSSSATSYEYCFDTSDDNVCSGTWAWTTQTNATLSGLLPNSTYYWQVRALNFTSGWISTYADGGSYWHFSTVMAMPVAFSKLGPTNQAKDQPVNPTLTWAASAGATDYEYCYDTSNDNACSTWTTTTQTNASLGGLARGATYYWQVRAKNTKGTTYANGAETAFWRFTTIPNPPAAFAKTGLADGAVAQTNAVALQWEASPGATHYEYCYDTSNDNACATWQVTSQTQVVLGGLPLNTTCYWQVRALNSGGTVYANGAATAFWHFTSGDAAVIYLPLVKR